MLVVVLKSIHSSSAELLAGKAWYHLKIAKLNKQIYIYSCEKSLKLLALFSSVIFENMYYLF